MTPYVPKPKPHGPRGFAAMSPEKRAAISSKGGTSAHAKGAAHEFTRDEASRAGRKGGEKVSADRYHMATIGSMGGRKRGENANKKREAENLGGCADLST
jgi:general stress protein YciG